jgi:sugar (pentulose or hexulose) kinase
MAHDDVLHSIQAGSTALGIDFGSTRIKAVLVGPDHAPLATGGYDWENQFSGRMWTYPLDAVWEGLRAAVTDLTEDLGERCAVARDAIGGMGISAMMHGYMAFDAAGNLLVPFRTWRNTTTQVAAEELTRLFSFTIPLRWSIAHLYQAIVDGEDHVGEIDYLTTLAGYVHWQLTGQRVLGVGDASGMFPIDPATGTYDAAMVAQFDALVADRGFAWRLADILPEVRTAGTEGGRLTAAGAARMDLGGWVRPGIPVCPPEGDAGTGMVATNCVAQRTGNVSAGTSIFAMIVLERALRAAHPEIDIVATPSGDPVAMVHCNNGASEVGEWCALFSQFAEAAGLPVDDAATFATLFRCAMQAEPGAGGLTAFNNLAGEPITGLAEGRPLFLRTPGSRFTLANFMRAQLFAMFATLHLGMAILSEEEGVGVEALFAHGGVFKTPGVAQSLLAAALNTPVSVGTSAGEGGPWGMALLAQYMQVAGQGRSLAEFLAEEVFAGAHLHTVPPAAGDVEGFAEFMARYIAALPVEQAAIAAG